VKGGRISQGMQKAGRRKEEIGGKEITKEAEGWEKEKT
jgi:hypothetical protein